MIKKLGIVLGVAVAISLVGLIIVGAVLAQGVTPTPSPAAPQAKLAFRGRGPGGIGGGMDEVARLLNMTVDQIWAERVLGKTIADLAKEKGVSTQTLIDALVASQKTMLDQVVTNGRLTQAQADKWLDWYEQAAALQLTEPYGLGFGGMRGGFGGMRGRGQWGHPGKTAPQSPIPTP